MNGSAYRPRSPAPFHPGSAEQGTLSTILAQLYRSAQSTFSSPSSPSANAPFVGLNSSSPLTALLPKLNPSPSSPSSRSASGSPSSASLIPSASTVGFVLLCALWYLSSAVSSNTGKSILTRFRYPVTLTFVQFAFVAGYSLLVLACRAQLSSASGTANGGLSRRGGNMGTLGGWGVRKPTKSMFNGTFIMSLFQIAGHVFSSMAIARVPVSTVHTIKALSPLFTVLSYVGLFGVRYSTPTYLSLLPLTLGVMLACSFDLRANAIGFLCALGSTFIFVAQNIFSKKLLPKESHGGAEEAKSGGGGGGGGGASGGASHAKLDKLNLLFYSSGMAWFLMIPIWLYSDASALFLSPAPPPLVTTPSDASSSTSSLVLYFFLNGTVHFGQNLLAFSLLARTSPVTYSIASLVKRIAVICIAIVWFGQKVSPLQGFGMTLTFGGLWMYNRAKGDVARGEKKRAAHEKRGELQLPTSMEDVRALEGTTPPPPEVPNGAAYAGQSHYAGSIAAYPPPHAHAHAGIHDGPRNRQLSQGTNGANPGLGVSLDGSTMGLGGDEQPPAGGGQYHR
ncbi:SPOSA6832_01897, partial [Sporobolomyces salmonicolor]